MGSVSDEFWYLIFRLTGPTPMKKLIKVYVYTMRKSSGQGRTSRRRDGGPFFFPSFFVIIMEMHTNIFVVMFCKHEAKHPDIIKTKT